MYTAAGYELTMTKSKSALVSIDAVFVDGSGIHAKAWVGRRWSFIVNYAKGPRVYLHPTCRLPFGHRERSMLASAIRAVEKLVVEMMPEAVGSLWLAANAAMYADL